MTTDKKPELKRCRTVGALIVELQKLPKTAKLTDPMRPVHYNKGKQAREMGLIPCVGFEED